MKKLIIVLALTLVFAAPLSSYAQTVTQDQINAQLMALINDLMKQVQDLMAKLVAVQTQQIADSQVLNTVVQQTQPQSFGGVSEPVVENPLNIAEQVDGKFQEMNKACYGKWSVPDLLENFRINFERTSSEWKAMDMATNRIEPLIRANIQKQIEGKPTDSISEIVCPSHSGRSADQEQVCQFVLTTATPYISCMLGQ